MNSTAQPSRRPESLRSPDASASHHHLHLAEWLLDAGKWLASPGPRDQPG